MEGRATPSPPLGLITVSPSAGTTAMHVPAARLVIPARSVLHAPPPPRHARRSHSFCRRDCSCLRSHSPRRCARFRDRAVSRSPPHLEHTRPFPRPMCTVSLAPVSPPGEVPTTSFSAPVLPTSALPSSHTVSPPRHTPRILVPLTEVSLSLPPTRVAPTSVGVSFPMGRPVQIHCSRFTVRRSTFPDCVRYSPPRGGLILSRRPQATADPQASRRARDVWSPQGGDTCPRRYSDHQCW